MMDLTKSPAQLKASILQDAMMGKLTQQLPEDGDAKDLLTQINAEKDALIKAKKIKKQKALPEIEDDEIPFEIPDNWQWVRLGEIYSILQVPTVSKNQYKENGIPFYRIKDIVSLSKGIKPSIDIFISKEDYFKNIKNKGNVASGDILITATGTLGTTFIVENDEPMYFQGSNNIIWLKNITNFNSKFINIILQSNEFSIQIKKMAKGSTLKHLSIGLLSNLPIPLPPLHEQERIVDKIDSLLPKVDEFNHSVEQLHNLREELPSRLSRSFLQSAMMGKLTKQLPEDGDAGDLLEQIKAEKEALVKAKKIKSQKPLPEIAADEIPFEIPDNWQWVRLGEISVLSSSSRIHKSDWRTNGIPFYRAREIVKLSNNKPIVDPLFIDEKTYEEKIKKSGKPRVNDILFTGVGTLGTSWIVDNSKFYYKDASVLLLNNLFNLNAKYLNLFFKSPLFFYQINSLSKGTAVKTLTITSSSKLIIPLPPLSEQKRIIEKLDNLFEELKG